jgi:hypothetical protein
MKSIKIALAIGALALVAGPAALAAGKPEGSPPYGSGAGRGHEAAAEHGGSGSGHGPEYTPAEPTPGPKAGLPEKAKAYGRYCQGKSKEHVKGKQGTEFSRCVTAMAKAATNPDMPPGQACKGDSKKHIKGEQGTEFSRCVVSAAKLRRHEHEEEGSA